MADETDTTSEVARVLREHEWRTESGGVRCRCQALLPTVTEYHDHQAAMLAEAGLLRDQAVIDERDMLKRGGRELGRQIERYLTWVLDATGMHHLIDEDGDGDWELVWERLAEMGRARVSQDAQIATYAPAGEPGARSAGRGTSGGLDGAAVDAGWIEYRFDEPMEIP